MDPVGVNVDNSIRAAQRVCYEDMRPFPCLPHSIGGSLAIRISDVYVLSTRYDLDLKENRAATLSGISSFLYQV